MKTHLFKLAFIFFLLIVTSHAFAQDPPDAPTNFVATGSSTEYKILLTWNDNSDNESGFSIYKEWSVGDYDYNERISTPANAISYTDSDLEANVTYHYELWAENEFGASSEVNAAGIVFRQPPPVPVNVSAATGPFFSIQVSFTDNSDMETSYEIQHTADPGDFYGRENVSGGALNSVITHFISDGPFNEFGPPTPEEVFYEGNTTVYVKVRAIINDHGKIIYGPFSPVVTAITNPAPVKATDFTATLEGDNVHLTWTDNSISEAAYFVTKYKTGQFTNGVPIFQVLANATEYTDYGGLEQNVEYTYVVRPVNIFEFSTARPEWWPTLMDDALTVKTTIMKVTLPAAVSDLAAVAIDSSTIDLSFTLLSENGSWYNVEIATSPDGPFSLWSDSGEPFMEVFYLEPNTTYYFRVQGVLELNDGVHYGPYSNIASATTLPISATLPEAPLAGLATFVTPTSFTANWIPVVGADYYELDVFNIKDSIYLPGYDGKIVYDTSLNVTGTRASRRYTYTVRAVNENGESVNSNTIFVTPIKGLTLRTVCSDNPTSVRVWKIINNNKVPVQVSWNVNSTTQSGTHLATIGESYFSTQTVSGLNKTTIRWLDDKLNEHFSTKSSTWKACDNDSTARSFVEVEEIEDVNTLLSIVAYPNSIQDKFHIKISSSSDREVQIEIINLQGKSMIKRTAASNTDLEFDASSYSSGIYLVRASQGTRFKTLKLLKQ